MHVKRDITNKINRFIDEFTPPILRDCQPFYALIYTALFGKKKAQYFLTFKERMLTMSPEEYGEYYEHTADSDGGRPTDINSLCLSLIKQSIKGEKVLDIACGRGYLCELLKDRYELTGVDLQLLDKLKNSTNVHYVEGSIEQIPFDDNAFDTVICAHTLEHIIDVQKAIFELRRVCKKRLIIIVPRQRPAKYTFDLHVRFFPYKYDLLMLMNPERSVRMVAECKVVDNDIFYVEDTVEEMSAYEK